LKKAEDLVKMMAQKESVSGVPTVLHGKPEAIVIYNNLGSIPSTIFQCPDDEQERASLALRLDQTMREKAPAGFRGDDAREKQVLNALFPIMSRDREATQAIFEIIKNQPGY
jgi:type I restriction enzyme R subunit